MASKSILVLHSGKTGNRAPKLSHEMEELYEIWSHIGAKQGFELFRGSIFDFTGECFKRVWLRRTSGWYRIGGVCRPTAVYDKSRLFNESANVFNLDVFWRREALSEHVRVVNHPYFSRLLSNRAFLPVIFKDAMPEAILREPREVVHNPKRSRIVLKKLYGSQGSAVHFTSALRTKLPDYSLEQYFVEAACQGRRQDTSIVFINSTPQYAFHRVAHKGSLSTSLSAGAQVEFTSLRSVERLVEYAKVIARPLGVFGQRVYSLDFLTHARTGKHYLIEANAMPSLGLLDAKRKESFLRNLSRMLLSSA